MLTIPRRPGPLQELPLEPFSLESTPTSKRNKRTLSPETPNTFSPAKRRILAQEGVFLPEKTIRSSLSSSADGRFAPSYFQDLVSGPGSPARRLDFGTSPGGSNKVTPSTSQLFADIPLHVASPPAASSSGSQSQDYLKSAISISDDPTGDYLFTSLSSSTNSTPLVIPCALYKQSIHYPGFDIWRDSYDESFSSPSSSDDSTRSISPPEAKLKDEGDKENMVPRRKSRKSFSCSETPMGLIKESMLSPVRKNRELERSGKPKPILATPRFSRITEGSTTPTRRFTDLDLTSGRRSNIDQEEFRRRREMLSLEADGDVEDDEDDEEEA